MPAYKRPAHKTLTLQSKPPAVQMQFPKKDSEPTLQVQPNEALEPTEALPVEPTEELPPTQFAPALTRHTNLPKGQDCQDLASTYTVAEKPAWLSQDPAATPSVPPTQTMRPTKELSQLGGDRHRQAPQSLEDWARLGAAAKRRNKGSSSLSMQPTARPSIGVAASAMPSLDDPQERNQKCEAEKHARAEAKRHRLEEEKRSEQKLKHRRKETEKCVREEAERQRLDEERRHVETTKKTAVEQVRIEKETGRLNSKQELHQKRDEVENRSCEEARRQRSDEETRREKERQLQSPRRAVASAGLLRGEAKRSVDEGDLKRYHSATSGMGFEVPASVARQIYSRSTKKKSLLDQRGVAYATSPEPTRIRELFVSPTQELLPSQELPQEQRTHSSQHVVSARNSTLVRELTPSQDLPQKRSKHRSRHSVNTQNLTPTQVLHASQEVPQISAAKAYDPKTYASSFARPDAVHTIAESPRQVAQQSPQQFASTWAAAAAHVDAAAYGAVSQEYAPSIAEQQPSHGAMNHEDTPAIVAKQPSQPSGGASTAMAAFSKAALLAFGECTPERTHPAAPAVDASTAPNSMFLEDTRGDDADGVLPQHAEQVTGGTIHDGEEVNTSYVHDLPQAFDARSEEKYGKDISPIVGAIMDQLGASSCVVKTLDAAKEPLLATIAERIEQGSQLAVAAEELARQLAQRQERMAGVYRVLGALL